MSHKQEKNVLILNNVANANKCEVNKNFLKTSRFSSNFLWNISFCTFNYSEYKRFWVMARCEEAFTKCMLIILPFFLYKELAGSQKCQLAAY